MFMWIRKILGYSEKSEEQNTDSETKNKLSILEKRIDTLFKANRELTSSLEEVLEVADNEALDKIDRLREKRNNDLKIINKNFELVNEKIKNSLTNTEKKYNGILELLADKLTDKDVPIDILSSEISLRKILRRKNQSEAALLATAYLLKKYFDNKGVRV